MALTAPATGVEKFIDPAAYIVSCETVADRGTVKTVLVTEERADFVTLQNTAASLPPNTSPPSGSAG